MTTFWLSYADETGFLGVVLIEGADFIDACRAAKQQALSPGGQVRGQELDPGVAALVPSEYRGRLLNREAVTVLDGVMEMRLKAAN